MKRIKTKCESCPNNKDETCKICGGKGEIIIPIIKFPKPPEFPEVKPMLKTDIKLVYRDEQHKD